MKNVRFILIWAGMLVGLTACHRSDYVQVVPREASVVVAANVANIAEEGDLAHSGLMQFVNKYLGLIVAGDAKQQFLHYMEHPDKMGIDFTRPLYFFKAGSFMGVTIRVGDEDDVEKFIQMLTSQGLCRNGGETDQVKQAILLDDIVIAYNSHTLLVIVNTVEGNVSQTGQIALGLMEQEKDYSFVSTDTYAQMDKRSDCDVVVYSNGAALSNDVLETIKSFIPKGIRLMDIEVFSSVSFEDGKAVLTADIQGKSNAAKKLIEEGNKNFHKIEGRYIDAPLEGFAVWACLGVKGTWLLDQLKQDEKAKMLLIALERAIDVEAILRAVDGDVAITLPRDYSGSHALSNADFMLLAEVKNKDFMKDVDYWTETMKEYGMSMTQKDDHYILKTPEYTLNWGLDGDDVYFASAKMFAANSISQRSQVLVPLQDEIKRNQFFVYVDLERLLSDANTGNVMVNNVVGQFKSVMFKSKSSNSLELVVEIKDSSLNFLKAILQ